MGGVKDTGELNLMLAVVKKYYELGLNQEQIAKEERISKSTVCRLIKRAEEDGYVTFCVAPPAGILFDLEEKLKACFGLEAVLVAPAFIDDPNVLLRDVCRAAARDLCAGLKPEDTLCVSGGAAVLDIARVLTDEFESRPVCAGVAAMSGLPVNAGEAAVQTRAVSLLADFFSAEKSIVRAPVVADSKAKVEAIKSTSAVTVALDAACSAKTAVFEIFSASAAKNVSKHGVLTDKDYKKLSQKNPVGEVGFRFYGADGKLSSVELDSRTISVPMPALKKMKVRMGIAVGRARVPAILGAVKGKIINRLYTDEHTARALLVTQGIRSTMLRVDMLKERLLKGL